MGRWAGSSVHGGDYTTGCSGCLDLDASWVLGAIWQDVEKALPWFFQPRKRKTRFPASFIFNGLQPLKMAAPPCAAHRLLKNRIFQQPGKPNPRFCNARQVILVHDESPGTFVPGTRAFHNPTFGQYDEAIGIGLTGEKIALVRVGPTPNILVGRMSNHLYLYLYLWKL